MILIPIISVVLIIAAMLGTVAGLIACFGSEDDEQGKLTKKQQVRMVEQRIKTGQTLGNNVVGAVKSMHSDAENSINKR